MNRTTSGSGGMYANHARAAELKAARARRAQEDAARVEDEQDQILEAIPATLEQFIVTGNRGRTTRSSTPIERIDGLRQNAQNMEHTSEAASENELSDSAADFMPASSQASCSHVSANNQPSERITHSVLRPSFSRTAQGYDTPPVEHGSSHVESASVEVPHQQRAFNPRAAHFSRPTHHANDDPFTEHGRNAYPAAYGRNDMVQSNAANQPSIRVTLPNARKPVNNDVQYPSHDIAEYQPMNSDHSHHPGSTLPPGFQRDHRPYTSFAAVNGHDQLLQQLYSLPGVEAKKRGLDSINATNLEPAPRGSGTDSRSSVQTSYYHPTPIGKPAGNAGPSMASQPRPGFDVDAPCPWKQRFGNIFKEPSTTKTEKLQTSVTSTPKSLRLPPGLNIPSTARLRPEVLAADTAEARSLRDAEDWWYRELKQRQDLHRHLANVAREDPYNHAPKGPGKMPVSGRILTSDVKGSGFVHAKKPASEMSNQKLLVAALSQLQTYVTGPDARNPRRFGQYSGRVGEWCIDQGPMGNRSFFDDNWGAPPPRVGRDPRYQTTFHEGRYTVFEEGDRRPARV